MARIGNTELDVHPLALGGNVFGWTADEDQSFTVLDTYVGNGGNLIDTADVYSAWAPGNSGGESEVVIGRWLQSRGKRDEVTIATKVGAHPEFNDLSATTVKKAAEQSLRRLGTDYIDLYFTHFDDPNTPVEETLAAYDDLIRQGKVRHIAASNISVERLSASLAAAEREGLPSYVALQPEYNLLARTTYENDYATFVQRNGLSVLPYFSLASGLLTGKYRPEETPQGARSSMIAKYVDSEHTPKVLAALEEIASEHDTQVATVALSWLLTKPMVVAPIASARTVEQLPALMGVADLRLTSEDIATLDAASG